MTIKNLASHFTEPLITMRKKCIHKSSTLNKEINLQESYQIMTGGITQI